TLQGHSAGVTSLAFSRDGTRLLSGSADTCDATIRLWHSNDGRQLRILEGHGGRFFPVAFSRDGSCLASGSADHTVRLWDVPTYGPSRILLRYPEWVLCISFFYPTEPVGCSDQAVWLCSTSTDANRRILRAHAGRVTSVAFSADGTSIVSGSTGHTVRLWDAASSANLLTFEKHSEWVTSVDFSSDDARVVSGSEDKNIRVWDVTRSAHLKALDGTDGRVLGFSADGTKLACRKIDGNVRVWHLSTG
ncbi:WD40-repeat-containing domain protein, partial [Mycena rosella]